MTELRVTALPPDRLTSLRARGTDELGNPIEAMAAEGGEPLRCCLRQAQPAESIAVISYSPFTQRSHWTEVGPVIVHFDECTGYVPSRELPEELRTGPRLLRTYHADGSLDYDDITLVSDAVDLEVFLRELLERPQVDRVHVRTVLPQCFLYEVSAQGEATST